MAENTNTKSATSSNGHKCEFTGCIHHEEAHCTSGGVVYKFRVHFRSLEEIYERATESMKRVVQLKAREEEPIPVRPGEYTDIYRDCSFVETLADRINKYAKMSEEEIQKALALRAQEDEARKLEDEAIQASLRARREAAQKAQSVHTQMNEPKVAVKK